MTDMNAKTRPRPGFRPWSLTSRLVLGLPLFASVALAQEAGTNTASEDADSDVVVLSPFTVSTAQDYGYRATNTISGTRTNTAIRDIPINIQVFTEELAQDLLMKNQVDMEHYNASLVYGAADRFSDNPIQQPYQNFLFRGFQQNWGLRDGIREYDPVDAQGLSRVEVVKGPAAPLYGLAYPGGVMNNVSKMAELGQDFARLRFTMGTQGDWRVTVDANNSGEMAGGGEFAVRFNGAQEYTKDQREHSGGKVELRNATMTWQPKTGTLVQFLIEEGYRDKTNGLNWFTRGEFGSATANQSAIPLQIDHPEISWDSNWADENNNRSLETHLYRASITQNWGDNFSVTGYWQYSTRLNIDGNGYDANGSGGADSWESPNSGWDPDANVIRSTYHYRDWGNKMHAYGATALYKFDFGDTHHKFAFGGAAWREDELSRDLGTSDQPIWVFPVSPNVDVHYPKFPPDGAGWQIPGPNGSGHHHEDNSNDYYFANWQMGALDNRLKTLIGFNKTNIKLVTWNSGASLTPDNEYEDDKVSPMYGIMYDVTPEVGLFVNHAESLFPDSSKDSFGNQFSPFVGKSIEGGAKLGLMDGKLSGTVAYFKIDQSGGSVQVNNHENRSTSQYDAIVNNSSLSLAQQVTALQSQFGNSVNSIPVTAESVTNGSLRAGMFAQGDRIPATNKQQSDGFDIDLIYQPTRSWQFLLSYEHVDYKDTGTGQANPQFIKDRYSLLAKYTFIEGGAKGTFLGLGVWGGAKSLQDYNGPNGTARYEPGRMEVDAFAGYKFKLGDHDSTIQLNIRNLLGEDDYVGWKATGSNSVIATERYRVPLDPVIRLTFGFDL